MNVIMKSDQFRDFLPGPVFGEVVFHICPIKPRVTGQRSHRSCLGRFHFVQLQVFQCVFGKSALRGPRVRFEEAPFHTVFQTKRKAVALLLWNIVRSAAGKAGDTGSEGGKFVK